MSLHRSAGPQVIQGRFPGGRPTVVQPKPATAQRQVAAHVQAAIHQGAPAFYRHVAQRKAVQEARRQASTAQRCQSGNATPLPATFHFAPSIGQPMPPQVQRKMEAFFGADFSEVRVHVGPQAQQIGAQAFTLGSDLYFAPGQYMPHHSHGQRLLGHELAHVVQQRAGRVRNPFGSGVAVVQHPGLEAEADRMGLRAATHSNSLQAKLPDPDRRVTAERDAPPFTALDPVIQRAASGYEADTEVEWVKYGANQSEQWHRVKKGHEDRMESTKLEQMYQGSDKLRVQRSYSEDRPKQVLRWLATILFNRYGGTEIQCYYDTETKMVVVSSNDEAVNAKMALDNSTQKLIALDSDTKDPRIARHSQKFFGRRPYEAQAPISAALEEGRIMIVEQHQEIKGLHAERRISAALGKDLDPAYLGGVKRPCSVCAYALRLVGSRPGPLWPSTAGLGGITQKEVEQHALAHGIMTHVTVTRAGKLTTGYDTESDSDAE